MHIILSNPGTLLRSKDGSFLIVQDEEERVVPPSKVRSITLSRGARITSDAIILAIRNNVDVIITDEFGNALGRVWSVKYGSISTIRKNQLAFFYSPLAIGWIKDLVKEKIRKSIALLRTLLKDKPDDVREKVEKAIGQMRDYIDKIDSVDEDLPWHDIIAEIRGWEGIAGKRYFEALSLLVDEKWRPKGRTKHPPKDPFNAMLSYAYGILYSRVEGALIKAGLDPYVGIYHRDEYNRPALVYDFIEKYRHWMDYVAVALANSGSLSEEMFVFEDGACWLDQLGKRVVAQASIDYLSEIVTLNGVKRSREEHIQRDAHAFAKFLLSLEGKLPNV
ncbi:MAG: CRISPR-associated endonuclease Cas1 [Chlorobi bacterium]|nr:CRISPR-associated endonuclease Cas1 [Chlorobiota bacterium]